MKCLCGRETTKEFKINKDKKIYLCPYCAHLIMRRNIIYLTNEKAYERIIKKISKEIDKIIKEKR